MSLLAEIVALALLPTASVLVHCSRTAVADATDGSSHDRNGVLVTCLLWLAAATFTTTTTTITATITKKDHVRLSHVRLWTFLVFFGTVMSTCLAAFLALKRGFECHPVVRAKVVIVIAVDMVVVLVNSLAPSALAALWWNIGWWSLATNHEEESLLSSSSSLKNNTVTESSGRWVALLVGALLVSYQCSRRWRMHSPWTLRHPTYYYRSDPYGSSSSSSPPPLSLNEYQWFEWTPRQVLIWMQSIWKQQVCRPNDPDSSATNCTNNDFYQDNNNNNDDDDADAERFPWNRLVREHIQGSQLDRLTRSELCSMGLPYGIALAIMDRMEQMTRKYPHPHRPSRDPANGISSSSSWLAQHDELYNSHRYPSTTEPNQQESSLTRRKPRVLEQTVETNLADHELDVERMDENLQKQAQKLMQERFGLELPPIRSRRGRPPPMPEQFQPDNERKPSAIAPLPLSREDDDTWIAVPPALLENAPPHIAEIVRTRPDLIQTVLRARKMKEQQLATSLRPLFEGPASGPDENEGENSEVEEEEVDSDNERAGLLHNSPSQQYKSTF